MPEIRKIRDYVDPLRREFAIQKARIQIYILFIVWLCIYVWYGDVGLFSLRLLYVSDRRACISAYLANNMTKEKNERKSKEALYDYNINLLSPSLVKLISMPSSDIIVTN